MAWMVSYGDGVVIKATARRASSRRQHIMVGIMRSLSIMARSRIVARQNIWRSRARHRDARIGVARHSIIGAPLS